jgi:hypothetical protein
MPLEQPVIKTLFGKTDWGIEIKLVGNLPCYFRAPAEPLSRCRDQPLGWNP